MDCEGIVSIRAYGAKGDGKTLDTAAFQAAIDKAAQIRGKVIVEPGEYLLGSVFLKSNIELHLQAGARLLGSKDIRQYPLVFSRVAGIEMEWPAALLNVFHAKNVRITGMGEIDGQGEYWWNKYWGKDGCGGLRKLYDSQNLRWIADYEIQRPRLLLVFESEQIELQDFTARRSGFWTIQVTYSCNVHIRGLIIKDNLGPSTDGIDIDSSAGVLIEKCIISCNDDDIAIKSGRDADGQRVNRICEDVEVRNCRILSGAGITLGSEVAGGICNIRIHDNVFINTDCGFRIKSSRPRGGEIKNISVENLSMINVQFPFSWLLDWFPEYNKITSMQSTLTGGAPPDYWQRIAAPVRPEKEGTKVRDITIKNVKAVLNDAYQKESRAFDIQGFEDKPIEKILFNNVQIDAAEFGNFVAVKNLKLENVIVSVLHKNTEANDAYDNR